MINRSSVFPASSILAVGPSYTGLASLILIKQSDPRVSDPVIKNVRIAYGSANPIQQIFQLSLSNTIPSEQTRGQTP